MAFPFGMQLILQRNYDTPVEVRRHRTPARAIDDFPGGRYPPRWKSLVMEGADGWAFAFGPGTPCDLCDVAIFHDVKLHLSYKVFYAATYYVICPHCRLPWYPPQWGPPEGHLRRIEAARMAILRELGLIYEASPQESAMLEGILTSIPMALIAASVQYIMKKTHGIVGMAREKKKRRGTLMPTRGQKKEREGWMGVDGGWMTSM
ncbi:uncharacterized protein BXZ73DRAFT_107132 [Epithele typhae]|uniref:uncharacterized protein n=1 Tax=Epithele typhae TaxID=378194 RepID=UPI0020085980|nr:uncharacterized protein BXZ73DRAFT_107132 [Epithele typhae]KAH9912989.1 hypothetical protein BXZ73DRAFT_107132 [Epithele typhae]